ncbi:P-loop NTPase fold protein [Phaeobacter sp. QD34_3]|uniref:KAP family P-loop NTPase fold protein n=1 Tax=unclassified Phaeobacter TaxID=2621772 RepID=UPI00237F051C|nr:MULTISPECIES: P-loop NTPase fold protein [unclassified Phaeobacter]MDE4133439.1 P-loop NTPase fold protein [Phaeobacter sp. QD34_3]MDE4137075.1 P-loop NTPase fold protein [Phaeobacter sp. QD34_24]
MTDSDSGTGANPWEGDRLGYSEVGDTFTTLIKSISDTKVISIEAGYGQGKTFFRERWAKQLKAEGEVVIEIDAHMSDHSGDPVLTFIGALIAALPESANPKRDKAIENGKKIVGVLGKTLAGVAAKQGMGALVDVVSGEASEALEGYEDLQGAVEKFGVGISKAAGALIAAQVTAERVRNVELKEQMEALRKALTEGNPNPRVVVLVDELDRCHPDYTIAFLEAMKLVFSHEGFVFCLFVDDAYLNGLAEHRFGKREAGERYLDKFVNIRLKLPQTEKALSNAAEDVFNTLPEGTPFGEGEEFTIARAARLAGEMAPLSGLTMRQIERVKLRVELAIRCYKNLPLDYALLVWLAFRDAVRDAVGAPLFDMKIFEDALPRSRLTRERAETLMSRLFKSSGGEHEYSAALKFVRSNCPELLNVPPSKPTDRRIQHEDSLVVLDGHGPNYMLNHEAVLNALHKYEIDQIGTST